MQSTTEVLAIIIIVIKQLYFRLLVWFLSHEWAEVSVTGVFLILSLTHSLSSPVKLDH